jgi:hypothetical protein
MLFFFPLGTPATWRLLAMRPPADRTPPDAPVVLDEVQALAGTYTGGTVLLRDPVWMTNFRLHHRAATHYRAVRVFLAGDAAHVHSPAGAQGMNTGIQDAVNLGWKLALTLRGGTDAALLDTYQAERAPTGKMVLRFTDRAFTIATSTNPIVRLARTRLGPAVIPLALKARTARAYAFRTVSQLDIRYRYSPCPLTARTRRARAPRPVTGYPTAALSTTDSQPGSTRPWPPPDGTCCSAGRLTPGPTRQRRSSVSATPASLPCTISPHRTRRARCTTPTGRHCAAKA